ncbi:MAG: demethylmenaquinone methyltransferase / 2-methoxy-6-polyprenyl,4-benzoquinol methylase [Clostridia bacterium]|jgi:demethylmenaquinone methyltransferase/2-methoxy-6-polyprenyl-1,4-benzoquinol methylase|nr:demethylmenaquinone methyltransferase / 2-methoxy-6-polyprenyl,4-benzoquinol methylase [Clostridia bacterium]
MAKEFNVPRGYKTKSEYVHWIFSTIAPKYDILNTLLSFNRDKYWRIQAVKAANVVPGNAVLDVCCGTGKFAFESLNSVKPQGKVVGLDFCENMLEIAKKSTPEEDKDSIEWVQGDASELPFQDNTFDAATIGFALRNVPDIKQTLKEMRRVVKPGGRVVSLELAKPSAPIFKQAYYFYFNILVPILGTLGIGKEGPYSYLPNSLKVFPHQEKIKAIFQEIGLKDAYYTELTGGIVAIHVGTK